MWYFYSVWALFIYNLNFYSSIGCVLAIELREDNFAKLELS
jgi:hypothetical protein